MVLTPDIVFVSSHTHFSFGQQAQVTRRAFDGTARNRGRMMEPILSSGLIPSLRKFLKPARSADEACTQSRAHNPQLKTCSSCSSSVDAVAVVHIHRHENKGNFFSSDLTDERHSWSDDKAAVNNEEKWTPANAAGMDDQHTTHLSHKSRSKPPLPFKTKAKGKLRVAFQSLCEGLTWSATARPVLPVPILSPFAV